MSNADNTLFFLKVYPDFFEELDKNIISLLNIKQTSNTEISAQDIQMVFRVARDMFSHFWLIDEEFWLLPTIRLFNSLSIPGADDIINALIADATHYANVIEPQIQKAWGKVKEIKIKQIVATMKEYNITLPDIEKYLPSTISQ